MTHSPSGGTRVRHAAAPPNLDPPPEEPRRSGTGGLAPKWRYAIGFVAIVAVIGAIVFVTQQGDPPPPPAETVHSVEGALGNRQAATLEVQSGAESVIIHAEPLDQLLYRASTLPGSKVAPVAGENGDTVQLSLTGTEIAGQATVHVYLNDKVKWTLTLAGGGLRQVVDFANGHLTGIEVKAGVQELDVTVPKAEGTMNIHVGGVGRLAVHAPTGIPAQLTLADKGTVGEVRLDDKVTKNVSGPAVMATAPDYASAADRYALQVDTAAAAVSVDRRP
ncbi:MULTISPECIES: hypothetical protein [Dactylosporangium]|uniref:Adhesin domain-containing protein n=2 Tax=Dactylosporangium TaxID=35753 RepID=A0A9W6NSH2_9ACTN|nr:MULTISPECIES: hypothetical protein [Dactylosporangium]UAB93373.1 hypothetical protein Dvina_34640 [Dactylosporangium vinaceum]UWZ41753.1 hypothetical protein Dmats_29465 [Dactylosporangium matsuzakiense]GLL08350.1 hypothetical protein GCM10017581_101110 [Dactylosporangium matsuzakiense]